MVHDSTTIGQADVDVARKAGWSDEALYDAITVCSLFQFYNNWIDATGVSDMPAIGYQMSGQRLATQGYTREPARKKSAPKKLAAKRAKKPKTVKRPRS
jgi:hypothetical protein